MADLNHAMSDISQRIEAARKSESELVAAYRTLLQTRRYVTLADEPRFVKGPKWDELPQENTKIITATEHVTELSKKNQHPDRKEPVHEKL